MFSNNDKTFIHTIIKHLIIVACSVLCAVAPSAEVERVTLQLKYFHQFQFAGYYAADLCGFYADNGLKVEIKELVPGMIVENELTEGRAEFATFNAQILPRWADGSDLFLMAFIHQKNPHVLMVHHNSPFHAINDILSVPKERLVGPITDNEIDIAVALKKLGHNINDFFPRKKNADDLLRFIKGELLVYPGFISNEPIRIRNAGIEVRTLTILPRTTIIPGDSLICSGKLWRKNPDLVKRFREASLRGWEYALSHPQEIIDHILVSRISSHLPQNRAHLTQEAIITTELIDADRFPLGHINIDRLENIAKLLNEAGLPGAVKSDLIFAPTNPMTNVLTYFGILLVAIAFCFILLALFTRRQHLSLTESKVHYQNLVDTADGFFAFRAHLLSNEKLRIETASRSIEQILGFPLATYKSNPDFFLEQIIHEDRQVLIDHFKALLNERQGRIRLRIRVNNPQHATPRNILLNATAMKTTDGLSLDGICLDFTSESMAEQERATLQTQLENSQRNESLGLLASGVAHDFNNILSAIRGNAELISKQVPVTQQHRMDRLFQAVDRASGLVRQILAYSGRGRIESKPLFLADELIQIDELLKHALPENVTTDLHVEDNLQPVMFDPAQFQQVAVNLIVNAAESYEGRSGSVRVMLDKFQDYIRLRVIDRGCGMDEHTKARIFDPYYTTKNHGHGLGLAAVQGIIAGVHGSITCESERGKGTTFTLLFTPCESNISTRIVSPTTSIIDGRQHVLVCDDDELVREITTQILENLGYSCLQASGGRECLEIIQNKRSRICLLILDCRMSDMDGISVLKAIREKGDRLHVLLVSGMINVDAVGLHLRDGRTRFLSKPFSQSQISNMLEVIFGSQSKRKQLDDSSRTAIMIADVIRQRQEDNNRLDS